MSRLRASRKPAAKTAATPAIAPIAMPALAPADKPLEEGAAGDEDDGSGGGFVCCVFDDDDELGGEVEDDVELLVVTEADRVAEILTAATVSQQLVSSPTRAKQVSRDSDEMYRTCKTHHNTRIRRLMCHHRVLSVGFLC